jgi:glycine cleavage system H lipoate-binding protein
MRCPFLREAQVKFCSASAFRKMIVRLPEQPENERCSSPDYVHCPAVKQHLEEHPNAVRCPFLTESLVQYCTAASVTKYIPYTESLLSQCGTDSHKYCDLFLALANPENTIPAVGQNQQPSVGEEIVSEIRVPVSLWYAPNHMWLDVTEEGMLHVGIDAFLAKTLGSIETITFVTVKGIQRPTVAFTVRGVDLQLVFPNQICVLRANTYLRTNPGKLLADPYGYGWLYEGEILKSSERSSVCHQLISGNEAIEWMKHEVERMSAFAHALTARSDVNGAVLMADGGGFCAGLAQHINRDELLQMSNEFFSPFADWRK